jgi:hypothetical protein
VWFILATPAWHKTVIPAPELFYSQLRKHAHDCSRQQHTNISKVSSYAYFHNSWCNFCTIDQNYITGIISVYMCVHACASTDGQCRTVNVALARAVAPTSRNIRDLARDLDCVPMATRRRAIEHMPGVTGGPIPALYKALATLTRSQQRAHTPA